MNGFTLLALLLLAVLAVARAQGNIFNKDSNIYEVTPASFNKVVHNSNYTSLVVFYAPWCGYCQQLKPVIHEVAKRLHEKGQYAAKVVAVNCDEDINKPLCAEHRVEGFPTVMVFRPPKYTEGSNHKVSKRHASEVHRGERTSKALTSLMMGRIKNYARLFRGWKLSVGDWLAQDSNRVLLISKQSQLSPLLKTLAIDFIDTLKFGMVSIKDDDNTTAISIDGKEIPVPQGQLPILAVYKDGEFSTFAGSTKNKQEISQWLIDVTGKLPLEGPLSKKDKKLAKYRLGKKKSPKKDEL